MLDAVGARDGPAASGGQRIAGRPCLGLLLMPFVEQPFIGMRVYAWFH